MTHKLIPGVSPERHAFLCNESERIRATNGRGTHPGLPNYRVAGHLLFQAWDTVQALRSNDSLYSVQSAKQRSLFLFFMREMERMGWFVTYDHRIRKDYPSLDDEHRQGGKGTLRFKARFYQVGLEIKFYQDNYNENPHGPEYGFRHWEAMTPSQRLQMRATMNALGRAAKARGLTDTTTPVMYSGAETILWDRLENRWSDDWVERGAGSTYNHIDADGKQLREGERRCFYDHNGNLCAGTLVYNINSMWWVIAGRARWNMGASQLFTWRPGIPRRDPGLRRSCLVRVLAAHVKAERFEKCIIIRDLLKAEDAA